MFNQYGHEPIEDPVEALAWTVRERHQPREKPSHPFGPDPAADIALSEIIEEKIGFEMPEVTELVRPTAKKRKKH